MTLPPLEDYERNMAAAAIIPCPWLPLAEITYAPMTKRPRIGFLPMGVSATMKGPRHAKRKETY